MTRKAKEKEKATTKAKGATVEMVRAPWGHDTQAGTRWREALSAFVADPSGATLAQLDTATSDMVVQASYNGIDCTGGLLLSRAIARGADLSTEAQIGIAAQLDAAELLASRLEIENINELVRRSRDAKSPREGKGQGKPRAPVYSEQHRKVLEQLVEALPGTMKSGDIKVPGLTVAKTKWRALDALRVLGFAELAEGSHCWRATAAGTRKIGR